jgi:hypothetical protein
MEQQTVGKLAAALAKAQGELPAPKKTKVAKAGQYSYHYADLADVIDVSKAILAKHGLSVSQPTSVTANGLVLVTKLLHESGESIEATYPLPALGKPQEMGSALTYARRYCYCAILGIAADSDDDGASAQHATNGNGGDHGQPGKGKTESPDTVKAREMYAGIAQAIAAATHPGDAALGLKVDRKDREDIAFIRKHGGDVAADRLHTLAAQKIAELTKPQEKKVA